MIKGLPSEGGGERDITAKTPSTPRPPRKRFFFHRLCRRVPTQVGLTKIVGFFANSALGVLGHVLSLSKGVLAVEIINYLIGFKYTPN